MRQDRRALLRFAIEMSEASLLLEQHRQGEPLAVEKLLPLVYEELRKLAAARLAVDAPCQTLQATALVHEAFLRIAEGDVAPWENTGHFFSAAAIAMRRILIERARRKQRLVHGGGRSREQRELDQLPAPVHEEDERLLALDAALEKLAERDPLKARLVELRYFAGLSGEQAAEVLGISASTVDRYWTYARAWLRREVGGA